MARKYAKMYLSMWEANSDFRNLSESAQRLYWVLMSSKKLSPAGCAIAQPRKWAQMASDSSVGGISDALDELQERRYVLIDEDTEEVLIRSFIRHDRGFRNQFLRKSVENAIAMIESPVLRSHAALELAACIESGANDQLEDSDEDSSQESYDDPDEDATEEASEANYTLQPQPAPSTSTFNQQAPSPAPGPAKAGPTPGAAALEILMKWKIKNTPDVNEVAYRKSVGPKLKDEHRDALLAYLQRRPNATADELAAHVLKVPGMSVQQSEPKRDWYANPNCECEGDGLRNEAEEGMPASYGPCPCRRPEQYPTLTLVPPPPDDDPPPAFKPRTEESA